MKNIDTQMRAVASDMASLLEQTFQANFERVTAEVGNAVDAKGAPMTLELYLDMLERIEIEFNQFGFPKMPTLAGSASTLETLRKEFDRFRTSAVLRDRANAVLRKKLEEWRDRESRRRLVT